MIEKWFFRYAIDAERYLTMLQDEIRLVLEDLIFMQNGAPPLVS